YLARVEERANPVRATAPAACIPLSCGGCRRIGIWVLAHNSPCDSAAGTIQRLLRLDRSSSVGGIVNRLTRSNRRGADPYARWCGRGGAARLPPIPINIVNPLRILKLAREPRKGCAPTEDAVANPEQEEDSSLECPEYTPPAVQVRSMVATRQD